MWTCPIPPQENRLGVRIEAGEMKSHEWGYIWGMDTRVSLPQEQIVEFCQRHHIRKLALFGLVLRDDFGLDSDVDVLVEFEPGAIIGWKIVEIEDELSELIGHEADLNTAEDLSRHFRGKVLRSAQVIYEREG
jgi:hypothetical protein